MRYQGDSRARTGRTTKIALDTLVLALENPGKIVPVIDHYPTRQARLNLLDMIVRNIIDAGLMPKFKIDKQKITIKFEG